MQVTEVKRSVEENALIELLCDAQNRGGKLADPWQQSDSTFAFKGKPNQKGVLEVTPLETQTGRSHCETAYRNRSVEDFLVFGSVFVERMQPDERSTKHKNLAVILMDINQTQGKCAANKVVSRLNHFLAEQGSPYVFSIERLSTGQDILSLHQKSTSKDQLIQSIGKIVFSESRPYNSRKIGYGIKTR